MPVPAVAFAAFGFLTMFAVAAESGAQSRVLIPRTRKRRHDTEAKVVVGGIWRDKAYLTSDIRSGIAQAGLGAATGVAGQNAVSAIAAAAGIATVAYRLSQRGVHIDDDEKAVLNALRESSRGLTESELAQWFGANVRTIRSVLHRLAHAHAINRDVLELVVLGHDGRWHSRV